MPLHGPVPSPPRRKYHTITSPTKTLRYDAFQDPSSSPHHPSVDRKKRPSSPVVVSNLSDNRSRRETFLEDTSPAEGIRNNEDGEDPHDLSFSPKHVPRASMVDSMVLSLDQFSSTSSSYPKYNSSSTHYGSSKPSRRKGHATSTSAGSENDLQEDLVASNSTSRDNWQSNTAKHQKDIHKLPSIFGEDDDSVRTRVYNSQRAAAPQKTTRRRQIHNNSRPRSKGSASSSVDLGHLAALSGRLGPAGNRRSQSFDFGSRRSKDLRITTGDLDVAPTPVIFAGPEAQGGPMSPSFNSPQINRKNSTRSSKSAYGRKARSGTLGTGTIKGKADDTVPEMPTMKMSSPPPNPAVDRVPSFAPIGDAAGPRPGFFRRVFGSSSRSLPTQSAPSPAPAPNTASRRDRDQHTLDNDMMSLTPPIKPQHTVGRDSTDVPMGKENFSTITKKSSAFFRRRKKSISGNVPPPMPLTLNDNLLTGQPGDVSPVSSLRAFMTPYLDEGQHAHPTPQFARQDGRPDSSPTYHTAFSTPQLPVDAQYETSKGTSDSSDQPPSKLRVPDAKCSSTLRIPHQDSYLNDSSSTEEPSKKSRNEIPSPSSDRPKTSPTNRSHPTNSSPWTEPSTNTEINLASRPSIPLRQESWQKVKKGSPLLSNASPAAPQDEKAAGPPSSLALLEGSRSSAHRADSDVSDYRSAPGTPMFVLPNANDDKNALRSPTFHISHPSVSENKSRNDREQAKRIFDNQDDDVDPENASAWLGEAGTERERIRKEYMQLFDWTGLNILAALRALCDRIALRGETQQVDRMLDAFAQRWCECNSNHGFKSGDVVHTICYSILLLNTDLHLADIGQKMTRTQFVRNALPTIKRVAEEAEAKDTIRVPSPSKRTSTLVSDRIGRHQSIEDDSAAYPNIGRSAEETLREENADAEPATNALGGPLVEAPFSGSDKAWEAQVEIVLKAFYAAIARQRLPLFGAPAELNSQPQPSANLLSMTGNMLRRTPSTLSKAPSDTFRGRANMDNKSIGSRWASKTRSRPKLGPNTAFGSSRTSLDDQSSQWSPSMSSTWSRASLGKTLTSMSVDSFGSDGLRGDYQSSIGFANALSQAIIRDDQLDIPMDDGPRAGSLLEDDSLELCGAPWAKEGIVKHKCHLDGVDKRSKDRNWNDCFAVVEKGWVRLFSFSVNAKSIRQKTKNQKAGAVVGGGNWQDNAEEVFKFMLRHTIASTLPPPGYSKARPFVWALSLPTGAVHLFSVGTPDIVKEFVSTANYWSARLSKEPMMGGVSSQEFGWSDSIINRNLLTSDAASLMSRGPMSPRPSTQMSMRSSMDHGPGSMRPKLPGDKVNISDWTPPQQSMMASQLMEVDQLRNLQIYVKNVEEDLQKHNELRPAMLLAFSARQPNAAKAMSNFEKKSAYLLREIVKFRTYIDILQTARSQQQKIYLMRKENDDSRRKEDDTRALGAAMGFE